MQRKTTMKKTMKSLFAPTLLTLLVAGLTATAAEPKKVLVVSVTAGFRHSEGIDASERILPKLAEQSGGAFTFDWCRQPAEPRAPRKPAALKPDADEAAKQKYQAELAQFEAAQAAFKAEQRDFQARLKKELEKLSPENLKKYDAVMFNNTTGDLPLPDREGFLDWIRSGKGFIGIHAATDTYPNFKGYIEMIGGQFAGHGDQATVEIINQDPAHPACKPITARPWVVHDEIYLLKNFDRKKVHGLLTLDKHPNNKTPGDYPIAYCKTYGQGRVIYTSLGHRGDVWDDDPNLKGRRNPPEVARAYQQHLIGAIKWALGLEPGDAEPQVK